MQLAAPVIARQPALDKDGAALGIPAPNGSDAYYPRSLRLSQTVWSYYRGAGGP